MQLVAGVDSSTQGCKLAIVDFDSGKIVREGRASHPVGTEVHPDSWWDALLSCINSVGGIGDVSAISISGQQHGLVALDSNGCVVRKALLWNDNRSAPSARALIEEVGGPDVYAKRVGIVPVASFTASKLRWVRDNEPENAARIAAVALPHDWLTWRLLGYGPENPNLEALTTDRSDASGTAYWSGETKSYDAELFFHALGRPMRVARGAIVAESSVIPGSVIVPRVLQPEERAGAMPNGKTIVGAGTGDNAGGALGLEINPGDAVVSLGTSGAVFTPLEHSLGDGDPTGVVAGFSSASGTHLPLVCTLNGARILVAAAKMLRLEEGPNALTSLALAAPSGSDGLVVLPYFEGERTPNLPTATASMHNMTLANMTPENIARAHVEALLCTMAQALDAIGKSSRSENEKVRRVLLIGGAAANRAVQEIAASVFTVEEIHVPEPNEYVARGAALQAAWALKGVKPRWPLVMARKIKCHNNPVVLDQYERAQKSVYPELFIS